MVVLGITYRTKYGSGARFRQTAVGVGDASRRQAEYWFSINEKDPRYMDISRAYRKKGFSDIYRVESYDDVPKLSQEDPPAKT